MQRGYFDLTSRQQEEALGLMMQWLLQARHRLGTPSNVPIFDEDVNVYLGHLLLAAIDPRYRALCDHYVAIHDVDVFAQVSHTDLPQLKSLIYRLNADHLLLIVSVFQPSQPAPGEAALVRSAQEGYGSTYYRFAAVYAKQRNPSSDGMSGVLDKLAGDFGKYALVLTEVRQEYFHFIEALSSRQFAAFAEEVRAQEQLQRMRSGRDAFLDAYSRWRRQPTTTHHQQLMAAAEILKHVDPTFRFDPPVLPPSPSP